MDGHAHGLAGHLDGEADAGFLEEGVLFSEKCASMVWSDLRRWSK